MPNNQRRRKPVLKTVLGFFLILAAGGGTAWWWRQQQETALPPGFAVSNGRLEATEIDIATQLPGRLDAVLFNEGDIVEAGQIVARMDSKTLEAQRRQAEAQLQQARNRRTTAQALLTQRQSELSFAQQELTRSRQLVAKGYLTREKLDQDQNRVQITEATLQAARAQIAETESAIAAAQAASERIQADIADSLLRAPRRGRIQYRLVEAGEVLPAGGKVYTLLDISDVYMTLFLPAHQAGRTAIGTEARLVLDAVPHYVFPATVSFVAAQAQFTPKTVETQSEREKLVYRLKLQVNPDLLHRYEPQVKTGLTGLGYVRLDPNAAWPANLEIALPPS